MFVSILYEIVSKICDFILINKSKNPNSFNKDPCSCSCFGSCGCFTFKNMLWRVLASHLKETVIVMDNTR